MTSTSAPFAVPCVGRTGPVRAQQPAAWRWLSGDTSLHLYADLSRWLPTADADGRDVVVSCGAALHHLRVELAAVEVDAAGGLARDACWVRDARTAARAWTAHRAAAGAAGAAGNAVWSFVIAPVGPQRCRLVSRSRAERSPSAGLRLATSVMDPLTLLMTRRLLGIKKRPERTAAAASAAAV